MTSSLAGLTAIVFARPPCGTSGCISDTRQMDADVA
jgi:hypothetical protein